MEVDYSADRTITVTLGLDITAGKAKGTTVHLTCDACGEGLLSMEELDGIVSEGIVEYAAREQGSKLYLVDTKHGTVEPNGKTASLLTRQTDLDKAFYANGEGEPTVNVAVPVVVEKTAWTPYGNNKQAALREEERNKKVELGRVVTAAWLARGLQADGSLQAIHVNFLFIRYRSGGTPKVAVTGDLEDPLDWPDWKTARRAPAPMGGAAAGNMHASMHPMMSMQQQQQQHPMMYPYPFPYQQYPPMMSTPNNAAAPAAAAAAGGSGGNAPTHPPEDDEVVSAYISRLCSRFAPLVGASGGNIIADDEVMSDFVSLVKIMGSDKQEFVSSFEPRMRAKAAAFITFVAENAI